MVMTSKARITVSLTWPAGAGNKTHTHTLSHSHTVYLVVFAQVYSQSIDEPDGGCRDRDSTLISAHLTDETVL